MPVLLVLLFLVSVSRADRFWSFCLSAQDACKQSVYRTFENADHTVEERDPCDLGKKHDCDKVIPQLSARDCKVDFKRFRQQSLEASNEYREKHRAKPLTQNSDLDSSAQKYAEKLAKRGKGFMEHSHIKGLGENIYWSNSSGGVSSSGYASVDAWYSEVEDYKYGEIGPSNRGAISGVGHFTQLVWQGSTEVGTGVAYEKDCKGLYVVAQYTPQGNFLGTFEKNVLKPKEKPKSEQDSKSKEKSEEDSKSAAATLGARYEPIILAALLYLVNYLRG